MTTKKILAIDQSTSSTGWAFSDMSWRPTCYGVIKTPTGTVGIDACWYQDNKLDELLQTLQPEVVLIEKLFAQEGFSGGKLNPYVIFLLGELRGMMRKTINQHGCEQIDIATHEIPIELGLKVTTRRPIKKRTARQRAAQRILGDRSRWKEMQEDASEAIVMLDIAFKKLAIPSPAPDCPENQPAGKR